MKEPKTLPCPACGGLDTAHVADEVDYVTFELFHFVECECCGMRGPRVYAEEAAAISAHNALPRALPWTTEPPKVAGWYWVRQKEDDDHPWVLPRIIKITNTNMVRSDYWQYAGPIPAPVEL